MDIPQSNKYALLILSINVDNNIMDNSQIANDLWINLQSPPLFLNVWKEYLGKHFLEQFKRANLFIVSMISSTTPEVLNNENEGLVMRIYRVYLGLLISVPFIKLRDSFIITGRKS